MLVPVLVLVLQRGCLSPLCIFFFARCCKWIRNVTQTTRQRVKRERKSGREGELEGNKVEKVREERKRNRIKTEPRTGNKPSEPNAQSKEEKTMPKFEDKFQTRGLDKGLPWCWADSAMRNFWPALQLPLPLPTHSTLDPLSTP